MNGWKRGVNGNFKKKKRNTIPLILSLTIYLPFPSLQEQGPRDWVNVFLFLRLKIF